MYITEKNNFADPGIVRLKNIKISSADDGVSFKQHSYFEGKNTLSSYY